ncbi:MULTISPECIES: YqgE/AlgH family protein [Pseudomonadaceae]|uniref:YqgE/AlgH family protein n=1 Tax=Pseudomonadaceae TaxID=135621 RepID=UPI0010403BF2|nr:MULTISPECIES: YqgE/AlgH family protein [Pseudomonadaceae]MBA1276492.1 YqgE/AlgH family protein [Stutzerimonas stutzeri]MBC8649000.1 YqgE/AlgH family protein [Pseudomonas sp. MT4]QXY92961.1 YqgE/AlgH family protein [Pseudomonas sp. MTM4]TCD22628.1 YqgE/AlgH family protein [Pseudomonas sp. IC_126]
MKNAKTSYLKHHFLIAMPHMADPNFAQALIYLVEHNRDGAMGLIINRPSGLNLLDILEQLRPDEPADPASQQVTVFSGGPVQTDRGFVLHPADAQFQATLGLGQLGVTTSQDVLFSIADGYGPKQHFIALGYAGWEPGQLEAELIDNAWLSCPAQPHILFDLPYDQRLNAAAASLGVDLGLLSTQVGHA